MITAIDLSKIDLITEDHEEILQALKETDEQAYENWEQLATDEQLEDYCSISEQIDTIQGWIDTNNESVAVYVEGFCCSGAVFIYRDNEACEWWDKSLSEAYVFTTEEELSEILEPYWVY